MLDKHKIQQETQSKTQSKNVKSLDIIFVQNNN